MKLMHNDKFSRNVGGIYQTQGARTTNNDLTSKDIALVK